MRVRVANSILIALLLLAPTAHGSDVSDDAVTISVEPAGKSHSLLEAQTRIRSALRAKRDRDVVVELGQGIHRVPPGGLRLTADDSPAPGYTLTWKGQTGGAGGTVLSGGDPVTGWTLLNDSRMPPGVMVAPVPSSIAPNATARQLYVNGTRALRTRMNASTFNASVAAAVPNPLDGCQWPGICLDGNKTSYSVASAAP